MPVANILSSGNLVPDVTTILRMCLYSFQRLSKTLHIKIENEYSYVFIDFLLNVVNTEFVDDYIL